MTQVALSQCLLNKMHRRGYNSKNIYTPANLHRLNFCSQGVTREVSSCMHLSALDRLSRSSYREAAATGTPKPCNRSRTLGTSGYSRTAWPRLSRTVPSLERARVCSAPAGPRLAPGLPSPASPALVERRVYVRVHPERPQRVICERKEGEVSAWAGAGPREHQLGFGKNCALRNSSQSSPSPRSKTTSFGSRAMTRARKLRARRRAFLPRLPGRPAGLREAATRAPPT